MSGRPTATDSRARAARFLTLVAEGLPADEAAKQAQLGPWKALRIVSEASFNDVVRAIREGAGPVVAIVEAPITEQAA